MNESEHLLTCLAEECAEVQQAIAKALRFGLSDGYPESGRTNAADIKKEMVDVMAIWEMLEELNILTLADDLDSDIAKKKERVIKYMNYAKSTGALRAQNKE